MLADLEYRLGVETGELKHYEAAAQLFPFVRYLRSSPAYGAIVQVDMAHIGTIPRAIRRDPNAADLWYGLARMELKAGNKVAYTEALAQLKRLTPGLDYQVAELRR